MPIVLRINGYLFWFFSNENNEPPHIHIKKGGATAKYWLTDIEEEYSYGFTVRERRDIRVIIQKHLNLLLEKWNEGKRKNSR